MKQKLLNVTIALLAIIVPSLIYAQSQEAAGTYNGKLDVFLSDYPAGSSTENVYLSVEDDTHITLEIKDFKFEIGEGSIDIGDILIPNVKLQKEESTIVILPADAQLNIPTIGNVDIHLNQSTITNNRLELNLNVTPVAPPLAVEVKFSGTKTGGSGILGIVTEKPTIYYNSATDALIVKGADNQMYDIYNVTGVQALSGVVNAEEINVSALSRGLYLIKVGNTTVKFIKR